MLKGAIKCDAWYPHAEGGAYTEVMTFPVSDEFYLSLMQPKYTTHVQNVGWQDWVTDGLMSGTEGKGLRLEEIKVEIPETDQDVSASYSTHVENIGWQDWVSDREMSGTEGLGYRLEAIKIKLEGKDADKYDVYYRVHAQNVGWMGWAKNGEESGTSGYGYRLESIEIQLVEKGASAPGSTDFAYRVAGESDETTEKKMVTIFRRERYKCIALY